MTLLKQCRQVDEAAGHKEHVSVCAKRKNKETCEEEEEERDEQVSLSFVIPSDSQSIIHLRGVVKCLVCVWELSPHLCLCAEQLLNQPEDRCTQTVDILPIHRQISLLNQMMVVSTQLTITVATVKEAEKDMSVCSLLFWVLILNQLTLLTENVIS